MSFKIAVCDDDVRVVMRIRELLEGNSDKYIIDYYQSGEELLKTNRKYNLIFLDIEMEKMNGLAVAKVLRDGKRDDYIVFLTSHVEVMSEAFKVKAFRFLSKPISERNFFEALYEAQKELLGGETVLINHDGEKHLVLQKNIIYIESLGDGTCVYLKDQNYVTGKFLKYWEEKLNSSMFYKIHKSYILNLAYVNTISQNQVLIKDLNVSLPISRRNKTEFNKSYLEYVKENARIL